MESTAEFGAATGTEAGAKAAAQTNPGLATDRRATANLSTQSGVEARLDLDAHTGLEAGTDSGAQPSAGIESAAEAGTESGTKAESGLHATAERCAQTGAETFAQSQADAVTDRGGQVRPTIHAEIQRLVGDHAGGRTRGGQESFHRREAELVRNSLRQARHRVRTDEVEPRDCGGGNRLNLLRADIGQTCVRERRIRVGDERLRSRLVVEQVKDELEQGVHWTFLPSLSESSIAGPVR
ncbi:hypothetical protein H7J51_20500 [Mycobacterium crocinum]|uniref:Uncharacterized protein n=1 Tax=Mycolicibacterium crocinum TaxID=388459 RepID=A0ABY3TT83_9MYCO|nr:hypothetical protein [Mycolicibacterium crocinum]MCV7217662.1 hypothetical protein [Mycolicibacterium crocinum]ULN42534.1 hypothetical protein MI149_05290 [Mycolicibacterium crocinum]